MNVDGLNAQEARRRLEQYGPNLVAREARGTTALRLAINALTDPMVVLLLVASPLYLLLGDYSSAAFTTFAVLPVAGMDVFLEYRAESALEKLRKIAAPLARVIRDGSERVLAAQEVVPGDLLILREGDIVAADAELIDGQFLTANEAVLTGESTTVEKSHDEAGDGRIVFAGTAVVAGHATATVIATGARTRMGEIATLVATSTSPDTPLQLSVKSLIARLGLIAVASCLGLVAIQLLYGEDLVDAILAGISLAIAAIPEEFSIVFALYLGLGAWRLTREKALVRRLVGVETLGSTSVICVDKTGTLTRGELAVAATVPGESVSEEAFLLTAVLACEAQPFDPLDLAIFDYARSRGYERPTGASLEVDYPFDPHLKYLTHVWATADGYWVASKGALEGILAVSKPASSVTEAAHAAHNRLAADGVRVIAIAGSSLAHPTGDRAADEAPLQFYGLVGFTDPVRDGVPEALAICRDAGVRVVMITGDHPVTALAIGGSLGLETMQSGEVWSGTDLDEMSDSRLNEVVAQGSVFARIRPEQKYRIVHALRLRGEVVAMTGDGVNDAPALREADIGVAMGERGTEVAREAATLVLLDDNFKTIVSAIHEGRRIFANLQRAFLYLIAFHIPIVFAALVVPMLNQPLFLTPVNLILLELILHPTVSLLFVNDPLGPGAMRAAPRPRTQGFIGLREAVLPVAIGTTLALGITLTYLWRIEGGASAEDARSLAFVTLLLGQILVALVLRVPDAPLWRAAYKSNRALPFTVGGSLVVIGAVVFVAPVRELMGMELLGWQEWLLSLALAALCTLWMEPLKAKSSSIRWRTSSR